MAELKAISNYDLMAWIIIPDHFHMIIDPKENNISDLMKKLKLKFAYQYRNAQKSHRATIWQSRFWDHIIRDQDDLNKHIDYIHYNPVKHGYVRDPFAWQESSIHDFLKNGLYTRDWCILDNEMADHDFGE